jgi:hypothetical protein
MQTKISSMLRVEFDTSFNFRNCDFDITATLNGDAYKLAFPFSVTA